MALSKPKLILIAAGGGIILIFALIFMGVIPGLRPPKLGPVGKGATLNVWGVFDADGVIAGPLSNAGGAATVNYRRFNEATYETELVNAMAAGKGPDIFMFHHTWLPKHLDKIVSAPPGMLSILDVRNLFPTVVEQDFAPDGVIFALPLYLDTLAMLYNKDTFDTKVVPLVPKTWADFENLVPRLREINAAGQILKAAAAIGGSAASVNRATDLLSLLMLQSGVQMTDRSFTTVNFDSEQGLQAFLFYTKFANPAERERFYTWNDNLEYSLDSFVEGTTAVIFNYAHQLQALKERNPFLRVGVAPLPQPSGASQEVSYANYWGLAVSSQSQHPEDAWQLVKNLTTSPDIIKEYLDAAHRPPALRTLINERIGDPAWDVFARQALTARSWPQIDNVAIERSLSEAIASVLNGRFSPGEALHKAKEEISELMSARARNP